MIRTLLTALFGQGNVVTEVAGAFRPNAENSAQRAADAQSAALMQFAAEFAQGRKGVFDSFVDGLNRLPRPIMALGTIGFFGLLMWDPVTFASRMAPLELVPDELWWLLGAVVTFYFGAREMAKARDRRKPGDVARVIDSVQRIEALRPIKPNDVSTDSRNPATPAADIAPGGATGNAAIDAWRAAQ